jgi:hypothetical protein
VVSANVDLVGTTRVSVSIAMIRSTDLTFSVDTTLKVVRVRRTVPVRRTGKVVEPVNVDLVGTT